MNIDQQTTISRIKTLTELHGAPGFEDNVKDYATITRLGFATLERLTP